MTKQKKDSKNKKLFKTGMREQSQLSIFHLSDFHSDQNLNSSTITEQIVPLDKQDSKSRCITYLFNRAFIFLNSGLSYKNIDHLSNTQNNLDYFYSNEFNWISESKQKFEKAMSLIASILILDESHYLSIYLKSYGSFDLSSKISHQLKIKEDCEKVIRLNPKFTPGYVIYGNILHHLKQHKEAIRQLTISIKLKPNFAAYEIRGRVNTSLMNFNDAIKDYSTALNFILHKKETSSILFQRGQTKVQMTDYEGARDDFRSALKNNPSYEDSIYFKIKINELPKPYKVHERDNQ